MRYLILCAALVAASPALAQMGDVPANAPFAVKRADGRVVSDPAVVGVTGEDYVAPMTDLIKERDGIRYVTGGVGDEEESALNALKSQFNLHILATAENGDYISFYELRILQGGNVVFEGRGEGPLFLIQLPAGSYTVEATYRDAAASTQKVRVTSKGHREVRFRW